MPGARANMRSEISVDTSKFSAAMRRVPMIANSAMQKVGRAISTGTKMMARLAMTTAKVGAALLAVGAGAGMALFLRGLKSAADAGGKMADLAARTSMAVRELVILRQAFADNGIEADKVGAVINKMQKALVDAGDGSAKMITAFDRIGVSLTEIRNLSPGQQFAAIQRGIAGIQDPAMRAALAMQIFGKAGGELNTLFADGGALTSAAKAVGNQADILEKNAATFDRISDILAQIPAKFQGFFVGVLQPLAAPLLEILEKFAATDFSGAGQAFGEKLRPVLDRMKSFMEGIEAQLGSGASLYTVMGNELELVALKFGESIYFQLMVAAQAFGDKMEGFVKAAALAPVTGMVSLAKKIVGAPDSPAAVKFEPLSPFSQRIGALEAGRRGRMAGAGGIGDYGAMIPTPGLKPLAHMPGFRPIQPVAGDSSSRWQPRGSVPTLGNAAMWRGKASDAMAGGFKGLGGLYQMQSERLSGIAPGANGIFAQDRARLGIKSDLQTGGIGATRRVGREKDEEAAKRQAELQKSTNEHLIEIKDKISESLSVN